MSEQAGPRRRPVEGGYSRGEETRARIIEAALRVFADEGYERASTRQIADEAGVRPPALQYYFDSKEGLHRACAEALLAYVGDVLGPALRESELPARDAADAVERLCALFEALVLAALAKDTSSSRARFMSRLQAEGAGPAWPLMRDGLLDPLLQTCIRLTAQALGTAPDDFVRLRACMLIAQLSAFGAAKETTLRALGAGAALWENPTLICAAVREHTHAALRSDT